MINLGHGARVFVPLTNNPDDGGGPVRRSPFALVPARSSQQVRSTPHAVTFAPASGYDPPDYSQVAFLPDGRLQSRDKFPPMTLFGAPSKANQAAQSALLGSMTALSAFGIAMAHDRGTTGPAIGSAGFGAFIGLMAYLARRP